MLIRYEFIVSRELLHRLALPHGRIVLDIVKHCGVQDKEAPIDPTSIFSRLLTHSDHARAVELENTETARLWDSGNCSQPSMSAMERNQLPQINVAQAVAI